MTAQTRLVRVPAREVVAGDRMGEGRWQGVQIVEVQAYPRLQDATTYHLSLGLHGWIDLGYNATVLVERASQNRDCGHLNHGADDHDCRPFCNTWPWPNSDADLVMPEDNAKVHQARGCCNGG